MPLPIFVIVVGLLLEIFTHEAGDKDEDACNTKLASPQVKFKVLPTFAKCNKGEPAPGNVTFKVNFGLCATCEVLSVLIW